MSIPDGNNVRGEKVELTKEEFDALVKAKAEKAKMEAGAPQKKAADANRK